MDGRLDYSFVGMSIIKRRSVGRAAGKVTVGIVQNIFS